VSQETGLYCPIHPLATTLRKRLTSQYSGRWFSWLTRTGLVVGAGLFTAVWTIKGVHKSYLGALTLGVFVAVLVISASLRWMASTPAVILVLVAVVPYPVSVIGKTPFGVVTAAGLVAVPFVLAGFVLREKLGTTGLSDPGIRILLVWMVWCAVSAATSFDPKDSLDYTRQILFSLPLAYLAGRVFGARKPAALRYCLGAVVVIAALAVVQAATGFDPIRLIPSNALAHFPLQDPGEAYRYGLVRVRVGFYHASDLGRVLAVSFPFFVVEGTRRDSPLWLKLGAGLTAVALILTLTFSDWIAAVLGLIVLVAASQVSRRYAGVALAVIVVVMAVGAGGAASQLIESRLHPSGSSLAEKNLRLAEVPASVDFADSHRLLGAGPGTFNLLNLGYPINGVETPLVDDNSFTTELVEVGYPWTILFAGGLSVLAIGWWRRRRMPYYAAALAGLSAWLVGAATVDPLARDAPLLAVWLLLGVATGAAHFSEVTDALPTLSNDRSEASVFTDRSPLPQSRFTHVEPPL
jgi:hypothetical protein